MVAPKHSILTMPLGQAPPFRPLPSAKRRKALPVIDEMHRWMADVPGETYANEVNVVGTGAWVDVRTAPPAPLTEVLRFTIPRPAPVTLIFHSWFPEDDRFRRAMRLNAEVQTTNPVFNLSWGRLFIEWGVGQARNWTYVDLASGSLQIPNASWVIVSAWTHSQNCTLAATAQIGYSHSNLDTTWTASIFTDVVGNFQVTLPPYSRELSGYLAANGLPAAANLVMQDFGGVNVQTFLLRSAVTPNPQTIPVHPIRATLTGGASLVIMNVTNIGTGPEARCTSVATVRL